MLSDYEITKKVKLLPIKEVAKKLDLGEDNLYLYGNDIAKITSFNSNKQGKLILVTSINPTPFGEGKSTVSVGLVDAFNKIGTKAVGCLREPSLGPVFGTKGGATGGGYSQLGPIDKINLHFTGDFHAITSANNLISAVLDNHIFQGNELNIDPDNITWTRVLDVNDRNLRDITVGHGKYGVEYDTKFQITVASEIMAIFCLAKDIEDLKERLENIVVAFNKNKEPIFVRDLKIIDSLILILKDAIHPNLVQTYENNPVIVHGGPFANIAHGCNSIRATKLGLSLADVVITEGGFGADLGFEKFLDIKSRVANIDIDFVVIVATIKAMRYQDESDITVGFNNLKRHINIVKQSGATPMVVLNKFDNDTKEDIELLEKFLEEEKVNFEISEMFLKGSEGGMHIAKSINKLLETNESNKQYFYQMEEDIEIKIRNIATKVYGANDIILSDKAKEKLKNYQDKLDISNHLICMAKTPASLSDNPKLLGAPTNFDITISDINIANGAKFIICYAGNILTMPGLSKTSNVFKIHLDEDLDMYKKED